MSGKKEFYEQRADRWAIPQGKDGYQCTLLLRYTGHFIVVGKFRIRSVTDIECYDELLLVLDKVAHDRQGGKYVIQKSGEYEDGQYSHKKYYIEKKKYCQRKRTVSLKCAKMQGCAAEQLLGRSSVRQGEAISRGEMRYRSREASAMPPGRRLILRLDSFLTPRPGWQFALSRLHDNP